MLQLERNNLASMVQLYERDKAHLEDCIQHMEETAKQRNEMLTHRSKDLEVKLAEEVKGKMSR